ncbi:MAG: hypothetical protein ACFFEY_09900 [Candidatus Thorarchaeota archaeon]
MLRTFVYDETKSNWIEEDKNILSHDFCAILDEDNEIIYLWNGPKSNKTKFRKGYKQIKYLFSNFPELNIQIVMAKNNFPIEVKNVINNILDSFNLRKDKVLRFSRFTTIRIYSISIILAVILPILQIVYLSTSLFWTISDGFYEVNNITYSNWINISKILIIIAIIAFSINILIGAIEIEHQVIIFSSIGLVISVGIILYLNQGVFLFLFHEGSTLTTYFISQRDIFVFLFFNIMAILIFEIPNIYKLISFFKTYRKFII